METYVNIDADIHSRTCHPLLQLFDNAVRSQSVDVTGLDDVEAASSVVSYVTLWPGDRAADSSMSGRVANQTLFMSNVQECTVVNPGIV